MTTTNPKDMWQELTTTELTEFEAGMLTDMLTAAILAGESHVVLISYLDDEKEITDSVITVAIIDGRNTILGQVFEAPTRIVQAIFKDWLAPGINEDGSFTEPDEVDEDDELDRLIKVFNEEKDFVTA